MERGREWSLFNKQTPVWFALRAVTLRSRCEFQRGKLLRGHLSNVRYLNNDAALGRVMRQNRKGFKGHSYRACIARRYVVAPRAIPSISCRMTVCLRCQSMPGRCYITWSIPASQSPSYIVQSSFESRAIWATNAILRPRYWGTRDKISRFRAICLFFLVFFKDHAIL